MSIDVQIRNEKVYLETVARRDGVDYNPAQNPSPGKRALHTQLLQAAIDLAAAAPGRPGGVVQLPHYCTFAPDIYIPASVSVIGAEASRDATVMAFTDGGVGNGFDPDVYGGEIGIFIEPRALGNRGLRNVKIVGATPDTWIDTFTPPEAYGTGVRTWSSGTIEELDISGFCYGFAVAPQHTNMRHLSLDGCWAPLFICQRDPIQGDGSMDDLVIGGRHCGVAIHPSHYMGGFDWGNSHLINMNYGIWVMAATRWLDDYTTGTVTGTADSTAITGSGTSWLTNVKRGQYFKTSGMSTPVMVRKVISDTSLQLVTAPGANFGAVSYAVYDGPGPKGAGVPASFCMGSMTLNDVAFEQVHKGLIVQEEIAAEDLTGYQPRSVANVTFRNCSTDSNGDGSDAAKAAFCVPMGNVTFENSSGLFNGNWSEAVIYGADLFGANDFGDVRTAAAWCRDNGRPFYNKAAGLGGVTLSGRGRIGDADVRFGLSGNTIVPGDLVSYEGTLDPAGNQFKSISRVTMPAGVAVTQGYGLDGTGAIQQGVLIISRGPTEIPANVVASVVVAEDAAIGATTIATLGTRVLGPSTTAVTLTDTAGGTLSATVADTTNLTVAALASAIPRGTQLWIAVTPASLVSARGVPVRATWGTDEYGFDPPRYQGQVRENVGGYGAQTTSVVVPIIGESRDPDNGRNVPMVFRGL